MKVLILGYGSIGKRHKEVLSSFDIVTKITIVTKQKLENLDTIYNLQDINCLSEYDYFIIASETHKHYEQLKYICSKVDKKKILVEKPLYDKKYDSIISNNKIFIAYNLRFHPVLQELFTLLQGEEIYYVNIICGQYLPTWRPYQDYKDSYSAKKEEGGGVLRDLSHELDYAIWLFGNIEKIDAINTKISDLEINSDDIFTAIAISQQKIIINLTIDYISKIPIRRLIVHTKEKTIEADVINNNINISFKDGTSKKIKIEMVDRNYTYATMHKNIINNNFEILCSFNNGEKIVDMISKIEFKEIANV